MVVRKKFLSPATLYFRLYVVILRYRLCQPVFPSATISILLYILLSTYLRDPRSLRAARVLRSRCPEKIDHISRKKRTIAILSMTIVPAIMIYVPNCSVVFHTLSTAICELSTSYPHSIFTILGVESVDNFVNLL